MSKSIRNQCKNTEFNLSKYFTIIEKEIIKVLNREEKYELTYDILDTKESKTNKMIILKEKQKQMKIGEIMQITLGNYHKFENLKIGHKSGCDIRSKERKILIELKNRTNTTRYILYV